VINLGELGEGGDRKHLALSFAFRFASLWLKAYFSMHPASSHTAYTYSPLTTLCFLFASMEVVGVVSSIASLVFLAAGVTKTCYTYLERVRQFQKETQAITRDVSQLSRLLQSLQPLVEEVGAEVPIPASNLLPPSLEAAKLRLEEKEMILIQEEIAACKGTLMGLKGLIDRSTPKKGQLGMRSLKRYIWPMKKEVLDDFQAKLARHIATFNLALSAYSTQVLIKEFC